MALKANAYFVVKSIIAYTYKQTDSRQLKFIDYHWKHEQPLTDLHDNDILRFFQDIYCNRDKESQHGEYAGQFAPMFISFGYHGIGDHYQDCPSGESLDE